MNENPKKGGYLGECYMGYCKKTESIYLNKLNKKHYCRSCTSLINLSARNAGHPEPCIKQSNSIRFITDDWN